MQKIEIAVYLKKTTVNYHIYESHDGSVIKYVKRDRLPKTPPDVLMDGTRTPLSTDLPGGAARTATWEPRQ